MKGLGIMPNEEITMTIADSAHPDRPLEGLVVNNLGEIFLKHKYVLGSIDLKALNEQLGHQASTDEIEAAFQRRLDEKLSPESAAFVKGVWDLQALNNARLRISAADGRVFLATEFKAMTDEKTVWRSIYRAAADLVAEVQIIDQGDEVDHMIENAGTSKERHVYGKNHGKQYRQVMLSIQVAGWTPGQVRRLMTRMKKLTEPAWKKAGVNVI